MSKSNIGLILKKPNDTKGTNLLFIVLPRNVFDKLESLPKGEERQKYFDSKSVQKKIVYQCESVFDPVQKLIYLGSCDLRFVSLFNETVYRFFESDVHIVAPYNPRLVQFGFDNPRICGSGVCLSKRDPLEISSSLKDVKTDLAFLKQNQGKEFCEIFLTIEQPTLDYLKHLTVGGVSKDKNTHKRSQKEYFGKFDISKRKVRGKNKIIYTIKVDKKSVFVGENEQTDGFDSLYNFHSHPFEAYQKYKVKTGVPSIADYVSVYVLALRGTIIHFVATLEGVYAISLNPEHVLVSEPPDQVIKFIQKNYDIPREDLDFYLATVNKLGLFHVELFPYKEGKLIKADFLKRGKYENCIIMP